MLYFYNCCAGSLGRISGLYAGMVISTFDEASSVCYYSGCFIDIKANMLGIDDCY